MRRGIFAAGLVGLCVFALIMSLQTGCKPAKSDEVPITTSSKEARDLFVEGRTLAEYWHLEKANELLTQAVEIDPTFAMAYLYKAGTSVGGETFKDDLAMAASLAENASEGEQKLIAGYSAMYGENDSLKASTIFEELVTLFPNDKRAHWYLAGSYGRMNERDKQIASLEKAIALDSTFAPAYETLGYVYRWLGQYDKAEESFKEYVRLSPEEANAHDILGDLYQKMGRFEDADEQFREAVTIDPTFTLSWYKIGPNLAFMGKYEEAREAIAKSMDMELDPGNKVYDQEAIMRTHIYEGDFAGALEAADKAIQMAGEYGLPEQASFDHIIKCALYCELGDFEKAEASLADCLNILETADLVASVKENQRASVTAWEAMIAAGREDFEAAQAKAEEYEEQIAAINNPALQKYPGWLYGYLALAQGDAAKAVEHLSQGELDNPWFIYYAAVAKEKAGDAAGAAELYKKAAGWNIDGAMYSLVRSKALDKL